MAFFAALRYDVKATCLTPLRTGYNNEEVLRYKDSTPYLQASALSGVMRCWAEKHIPDQVSALFGDGIIESELVVSDAVFKSDSIQDLRPHIKIDDRYLIEFKKHKFDIAALRNGSECSFYLIWTGSTERLIERETAIESMLGAIDAGHIRLGAHKSNGFGRVSLSVKKRCFDLTDAKDREDWLEQCQATETIVLPKISDNSHTVFRVRAFAPSILSKGPVAHNSNSRIETNLHEGDQYIMPSSSIKGVVRSRISAIINSGKFKLDQRDVERWFGCSANNSVSNTDIAGTIIFSDARLNRPDSVHPIFRININRFTGGIMSGGLFGEEPLSSMLEFSITVPCDNAACAMILFALRDLGIGLYSLGSGRSIGRGYLEVESVTAECPDGRSVVMTFDEGARFEIGQEVANEWLKALGGARDEN